MGLGAEGFLEDGEVGLEVDELVVEAEDFSSGEGAVAKDFRR